MKFLRALLTGATVIALSASGFTAAAATAADPSSSMSSCTPVRQSGSSHVDSAGRGTTDQSAATKHVYSSSGTALTTVAPPQGFDFRTASDQQLAAYGFRPRPKDKAGLERWNQEHDHAKVFTDWSGGHGFCFTDRQNVAPAYLKQSAIGAGSAADFYNWSGLLATNGGYNEVDGEWTEPTFTSTCAASGSSYTMWPGLGGTNGTGLIQAGTDTASDSPNDVYTWLELISPQHPFPEMATNAPISTGDTIAVYVWWDATNNSADFEFDNITQGWDGSVGVTAVSGVPASAFYSGSSAEVITERNTDTGTGQFRQLRQPSGNIAYYTDMRINNGPAYLDSSLQQSAMVNTGGNLLSTVDNYAALTNYGFVDWDTTWHACS